MSYPTPIRSFLGGVGLALPVHALLVLNGNVFGISGFLHRAARGGKDALVGVSGLVLGGVFIGLLEGHGPKPFNLPLLQILLSGFLVGLGTKLSNGCTSGHMLSGVSRFSPRSIVATITFFITAAMTTQLLHKNLPSTGASDWTLGHHGKGLIVSQVAPLVISILLYLLTPKITTTDLTPAEVSTSLRKLAFFSTSFEFALALRLSSLSESQRVLAFLLLPLNPSFDPSLAFLAVGALPASAVLYQYYRGPEKPRLGGIWSVPKGGNIDTKLVTGAALFGVGWGMGGICPGPGLVNFGRALAGGSGTLPFAVWIGAVVIGGLFP